MIQIIRYYKLFLVLYVSWILLTLKFELANLIIGLISCLIVMRASKDIIYDEEGPIVKIPSILTLLKFSFVLIGEIYKSSFSHIKRIIKRESNPIFYEVELSTNDPIIVTIISNAITLTPGTITVDTKDNKLIVLSIKDYGEDKDSFSNYIKEKFEKLFL